ncbi:NUMOD4 [uncultured Caudovirales phage]|uniref:NUMOD4 n=1 Tax=uncultured Caudovirales phage TaxID=2100421 RepID=A0A6J5NIE0_9CAUD|nr:NUMOD4 [uncultured Caudovirales phage]
MEEWKVIQIENLQDYSVSNLGRVKSNKFGKEKILKQNRMYQGYWTIKLKLNKCYFVHRLVASHFIENKNNLSDVDHINGNKSDNRVINLQWLSRKNNVIKYYSNKT